MGISSFFRTPEYNVFHYRPRYYDAEKEERKERLRQLRIEMGKNPDFDLEEEDLNKPGARIKGSFKNRVSYRTYRQRSSTIRFIVILGFLFFIAYLILVADLAPLISYLSK